LAWIGTVLWLAISALVFFGFSGGEAALDPLRVLMVPVAVLGPVALIWIAAILSQRMDALARSLSGVRAPGDLAEMSKKLDTALAAISRPTYTTPTTVAQPKPASVQAALRLDPKPDAEVEPLSVGDLISALQFPADADDREGFRALRRALSDHHGKIVVTAAQDVLTLLSQDGIYTDDLSVERARPELWRRFATGERGARIGAVGGIREEEPLALVTQRLRVDTIFRDASLHFLRVFDQLLARVEPRLSDGELAQLSETRTARAFMLLGRALGTFD